MGFSRLVIFQCAACVSGSWITKHCPLATLNPSPCPTCASIGNQLVYNHQPIRMGKPGIIKHLKPRTNSPCFCNRLDDSAGPPFCVFPMDWKAAAWARKASNGEAYGSIWKHMATTLEGNPWQLQIHLEEIHRDWGCSTMFHYVPLPGARLDSNSNWWRGPGIRNTEVSRATSPDTCAGEGRTLQGRMVSTEVPQPWHLHRARKISKLQDLMIRLPMATKYQVLKTGHLPISSLQFPDLLKVRQGGPAPVMDVYFAAGINCWGHCYRPQLSLSQQCNGPWWTHLPRPWNPWNLIWNPGRCFMVWAMEIDSPTLEIEIVRSSMLDMLGSQQTTFRLIQTLRNDPAEASLAPHRLVVLVQAPVLHRVAQPPGQPAELLEGWPWKWLDVGTGWDVGPPKCDI